MSGNNQESKFLDRLIIWMFFSLFAIPPTVWYSTQKTLFETGIFLTQSMASFGAVLLFWSFWINPSKKVGDFLSIILIFGFLNISMWLELSFVGLFIGQSNFDNSLNLFGKLLKAMLE